MLGKAHTILTIEAENQWAFVRLWPVVVFPAMNRLTPEPVRGFDDQSPGRMERGWFAPLNSTKWVEGGSSSLRAGH